MPKPILSVDFDGVLHAYTSGWRGPDVIPDPPVPGAIESLLEYAEHFVVCVHSSRFNYENGYTVARSAEIHEAVAAWLVRHGVPADRILRHADAPGLRLGDPSSYRDGATPRSIHLCTTKPPAHVTLDDRGWTFDGRWPTSQELLATRPWNKRDPADLQEGVPGDRGSIAVSVVRCARCGGDHPELPFRRLGIPSGEWTYWASCPATGEPVWMAVVRPDGGALAIEGPADTLGHLDRLLGLEAAVKRVLAQKLDDVCWRDVYTELAGLVGVELKPELLPREQFLHNCSRFYDSLASGESYVAPGPDPEAFAADLQADLAAMSPEARMRLFAEFIPAVAGDYCLGCGGEAVECGGACRHDA